MKKLVPIAIVVTVLIILGLVCSNSVLSTGSQANQTLAMMTNLKLADTMKTQALTIDHMAWGYVIGFVALAVVLVILVAALVRTRDQSGSDTNGWSWKMRQMDGAGMPRYISLDIPRMRLYLSKINHEQAVWLLDQLYVIQSLIEQKIGYSQPVEKLPAKRHDSLEARWR